MIVCGQFKLLKESLNGLIHYRLIQFVKIFRKKYRDIAAYISKVLVIVQQKYMSRHIYSLL